MADTDIKKQVEKLGDATRKVRQSAAQKIAKHAQKNLNDVIPYTSDLIDGLERPEAQTRWELLNVLAEIARVEPQATNKAHEEAEIALFDENEPKVRVAAYNYFAAWGATTKKRSDTAWKLMNEALKCYHGDYDYKDMLEITASFAKGIISDATKKGIKARAKEDISNNSSSIITHIATEIEKSLK